MIVDEEAGHCNGSSQESGRSVEALRYFCKAAEFIASAGEVTISVNDFTASLVLRTCVLLRESRTHSLRVF